jgi:uncharacterized RDD family membrane protein YckC
LVEKILPSLAGLRKMIALSLAAILTSTAPKRASASAPDPAPSASRAPPDRVMRVRVTGFARRFVAAVVDAAILFALSLAVTIVTALILGAPMPHSKEIGPDLLVAGILDRNPMAVGAIGLFLGLTVLYQLYFASMSGQTIGMRLCHIRLISSRGRPPGPVRGLIRVAALAVSVLPGGLGWLWAIFDREHRALHDHLAGTYVILDV